MNPETCWDSFRGEGKAVTDQVTALVNDGHAKRSAASSRAVASSQNSR